MFKFIKRNQWYIIFFSISDITIDDEGSFTCELKGGNIIKQRQSIFILSTSLIIHHTKTVICLFNKEGKAWFLEKQIYVPIFVIYKHVIDFNEIYIFSNDTAT